ncbi:MAG: hypothetical protein HYV02_02860 [Deltaproteobacteria bacterium]|nr:hypothetical protein [Deltaproteobacteria bacterium]
MRNFAQRTVVVFLIVGLLGCSGSTASDTTETTETTTATLNDLTTFVQWAGHTWDDLVAQLSVSKAFSVDFPIPCAGGGTITSDGTTISLNDCTETYGETTYVTRGTYTVTTSGSLTTHAWEQSIIVDGSTTFSCTGSVSFNTSDDLVAFDYSGTFTSGTFRLTGTVADNSDGTSDCIFSVLLDGEAWQDGLFDDTDLDALTETQVDQACTDDDDPACATLECANDFQCQLFADDNTSDEYETGNIECASGCCALKSSVSECPDSAPCSTDFQCQLFADDSTTDVFETDNVTCADDGCCAVVE